MGNSGLAFAKMLDELQNMETRLTGAIEGRCHSIERIVDDRCTTIGKHFEQRCGDIEHQLADAKQHANVRGAPDIRRNVTRESTDVWSGAD
jgi:hypothetical protein